MKRLCITAALVWLVVCPSLAQDTTDNGFRLPEGLGLANQLKYSFDKDTKQEILEDWLNLDYHYRAFSAGIRYDVLQPKDPSIARGKDRYADIGFKYVGAVVGDAKEGAEITVGNYFALFGRGLILKSYEDRNLRVDYNLQGVKITGHYAGFQLTALSGSIENVSQTRIDLLHAFDLEYKGLRWMKTGVTFASDQPDAPGAARTRLASVRFEPTFWNFDFYGEYGIKQNDDIKQNTFNGSRALAGRAVYASGNFYFGTFSLLGEYKYYDNYGFSASSDNTAKFNTPPALRRDYSYILLNRHPSPLNPDNEQGFALETNYGIDEQTELDASYGLTKTLNAGSYYQLINNSSVDVRTQLKDAYGHVKRTWSDNYMTTVALGYSEELDTDTKNLTPILETRYSLDETNTLRGVIEHQLTTVRNTNEQYYDDVLTLEYLRAPNLTFSLVAEMQTREPLPGTKDRTYWMFGQVGFKISDHTEASVLVGSRQAGNICIGGVCRYEPEFKGIELKMQTRL